MLWMYGFYKYYNSSSAVIDFRRQILTSKVDPQAVRVDFESDYSTWDMLSKTILLLNAVLMLFHRRRRWPNI